MILKKCVRRDLFTLVLGVDDKRIFLWSFNFIEMLPSLEHFRSLLSGEELTQANAFKFEKDRQRYTVFHGAMREVLAAYVNAASPKDLKFMRQEKGKPYIDGIEFNLSHSQDHAVFAVTHGTRVGVDIENSNRTAEYLSLAQRFFHSDEAAHLKTLSGQEQQRVFYRYWTAKEAFVKALGEGVMFGLDKFSIDVNAPAISWIAEEKNLPIDNWQLAFFVTPEDYQGALTYEGKQRELVTHYLRP